MKCFILGKNFRFDQNKDDEQRLEQAGNLIGDTLNSKLRRFPVLTTSQPGANPTTTSYRVLKNKNIFFCFKDAVAYFKACVVVVN
jgi:hypothetical protein